MSEIISDESKNKIDVLLGKDGYVYCFSNPSFHTHDGKPIYKIGETYREPPVRAKELSNKKTSVPTPFKVEFAIFVSDRCRTENDIHYIFDDDRVNHKREYFTTNIDKIKRIFLLKQPNNHSWWNNNEEYEINTTPRDISSPNIKKKQTTRKMKDADFPDGAQIRHETGITNGPWIGTYNKKLNVIQYNNVPYKSPSKFGVEHKRAVKPEKNHSCNGWTECDIKINNKWVKLDDLYPNTTN
jgi:hypothetical protein